MATPPDFTTGQVLTAAQMNAVGLWLIKEQTIGSAVSSVTVTGAFSADYDAYKIIITGGAGSTGGIDLRFNFDGNTTAYYSCVIYYSYGSGLGTASGFGESNAAYFNRAGYAETTNIMMSMDVFDPFTAKPSSFLAVMPKTATGGAGHSTQGFHNSSTSFTAFRIQTSAGTLTGGTIRVYGYKIG